MPENRIMGRPKIENPLSIKVTVRFDTKTFTDLEKYCISTNQTKAQVLRKGFYALKGKK